MIGVGSRFPRCPQHVVANLSGGSHGQPPQLLGAVVNGPNDSGLLADGLGEFFDERRTCPAHSDRFGAVNGHGSSFVDDVRSWQTVEPAIDFTASAALAFALGAQAG
jgi:endoglucanase